MKRTLYRSKDLLNYDQTIIELNKSLASAEYYAKLTHDCHSIFDEKRDNLEMLKDIVTILTWTYGRKRIRFQFTRKQKFTNTVSLMDVLDDSKFNVWNNRIHISPISPYNHNCAIVYINF